MYLERKAYPKATGLVPAQQDKSFLRQGTKPVLVTDYLKDPNPAPQDAEQSTRQETPLDRQRRLRARLTPRLFTIQGSWS